MHTHVQVPVRVSCHIAFIIFQHVRYLNNQHYFLLCLTELAILILERHEELVTYMNERGMSPLHLLASKPQIFRSCTYFTWLERIIYSCKTDSQSHHSLDITNNLPYIYNAFTGNR